MGAKLLALMFFPADEDLRRAYYARAVLDAAIKTAPPDTSVTLPSVILRDLMNGPSNPVMEQKQLESFKRGIFAGEIALAMYLMHTFEELGLPSFTRVLKGLENQLRGQRSKDGKGIRAAQSSLRSHFSEFRNVAHLWGAQAFVRNCTHPDEARDLLITQPGVNAFLGIAYLIQEFAINHPMQVADSTEHRTLVDPVTAFLVPKQYADSTFPLTSAPANFLDVFPLPKKGGRPR